MTESDSEADVIKLDLNITQVSLIRSVYSEFLFAYGFVFFEKTIEATENQVLALHKKLEPIFNLTKYITFERDSEDTSDDFLKIKSKTLCLIFSAIEINLLNKVLELTTEALEKWEFPIRTGYEFEKAKELTNLISNLLQKLSKNERQSVSICVSFNNATNLTAVILDANWLLCSHCQEAWECEARNPLIICPRCNKALFNPLYE